MRKLIGAFALLALLSACRSKPTTVTIPATVGAGISGGPAGGAADPMAALRSFLSAAKAQDLQALSLAWGTKNGSARANMEQAYLEKAEIVIIKCIAHDSYDVIGDAPGLAGARVFAVALRSKDLTRTTNFNVIRGPAERWFVEAVDLVPLQDFCNRR